MIYNVSFNRCCDVCPVVGGLVIDINEALRTGIVKDTGMEVEYNGIEDPTLIRGRVDNVFDAIGERNSVVHKEIHRVKSKSGVNPEAGEGE